MTNFLRYLYVNLPYIFILLMSLTIFVYVGTTFLPTITLTPHLIYLGLLGVGIIGLLTLRRRLWVLSFPLLLDRVEVSIDIQDREGKRALYRKVQSAIVNSSKLDILFEKGIVCSGSFTEPKVSPGAISGKSNLFGASDFIIEYRPPLRRGERINREFVVCYLDSFTKNSEFFQLRITNPCRKVQVEINFPEERECKEVSLHRLRGALEYPEKSKPQLLNIAGRSKIVWKKKHPTYLDVYIISWVW
jgi:hypothetical protein